MAVRAISQNNANTACTTYLCHFCLDYKKRLLQLVPSTTYFYRLVCVAFADCDKHRILIQQIYYPENDFLLYSTKIIVITLLCVLTHYYYLCFCHIIATNSIYTRYIWVKIPLRIP